MKKTVNAIFPRKNELVLQSKFFRLWLINHKKTNYSINKPIGLNFLSNANGVQVYSPMSLQVLSLFTLITFCLMTLIFVVTTLQN